jgi:DNA-binding transcriptional ArsR family regulator
MTEPDPDALIATLNHPLRRRILRVLNHQEAASPVELSRSLQEPIGNISYHMKCMRNLDVVELVRTKPVRGTIEHFYRSILPDLDGEADWVRAVLDTAKEHDGDR